MNGWALLGMFIAGVVVGADLTAHHYYWKLGGRK